MGTVLPQQQLLLELLIMSGDIAVAEDTKGTILGRTLEVVVNMVGFKLGEEELGLYIEKVAQTLAVTYCLANEKASR